MRKNLKWREVQPGLVAISDQAGFRELANCYLNNLAIELRDYCPVKEQIGQQRFPVYKQTGSKRRKNEVIVKIADTIPVDWYRKFRREYQKYGVGGVIRIIKNLHWRFNIDNLSESQRAGLDVEQLKSYQLLDNYFSGLVMCIENNCLPKREHHELLDNTRIERENTISNATEGGRISGV